MISNESGCGRRRAAQADLRRDRRSDHAAVPALVLPGFQQYAGHEEQLPIDQHELLALIAPRPLYVASAAGDQWADPRGEFLPRRARDPVYRLLGTDGLGVGDMPAVDHPGRRDDRLHVRSGEHDLTRYDWEQYVRFADRHFKR